MHCSDWLWFCESLDEDVLNMSPRYAEAYDEDDEVLPSLKLWRGLGNLLWRCLCPRMP
jgi:hypothetical protein